MGLPVIASPHILQVDSTYYDLRKVVMWNDALNPMGAATHVSVTFQTGDEHVRVKIDKAVFLAAKAASLAAGG